VRRAALAALLLVPACGSSEVTVQHSAFADVPKLDYARPSSIDDAGDYVLPPRPKRRPTRSSARTRFTGDHELPPESVKRCESGGNYQAQNSGSSASGAWQIIDGTWGGYGGYEHAKDAPPELQDEKAALLWAGGRGASHWEACL
jgi:hypothetical protein